MIPKTDPNIKKYGLVDDFIDEVNNTIDDHCRSNHGEKAEYDGDELGFIGFFFFGVVGYDESKSYPDDDTDRDDGGDDLDTLDSCRYENTKI